MESLAQFAPPPRRPALQTTVTSISDVSQVAVARRAAQEAGHLLGLDPDSISRAEIVAVELANNILQHSGSSKVVALAGRFPRAGELLIGSSVCGTAVQIVAIDAGAGIRNIPRALDDGFSTASTPGNGLGAIRRLSRQFDLYSIPQPVDFAPEPRASFQGTVISSIVGAPVPATHLAVLSTAVPFETVSGDAWTLIESPAHDELILLVDGLGHGPHAHEAASLAVELFHRFAVPQPGGPIKPSTAILEQMHPFMRATRGAAIAILRIDRSARTIHFCGVGNIAAQLQAHDGRTRSMVSHNGTLGHQMPRVQEFPYPYTPGTLLIAHSDGITTSWRLANYPGLDQHAPATIAGVLYRDAWRGRDDATLLVRHLD